MEAASRPMIQKMGVDTPPAFPPTTSSVGHERADGATTALDAFLATEDVYTLPSGKIAELRVVHLRDAMVRALEGSADYAQYCERVGFDVEFVQAESDISKIPLMPTGVFKRRSALPRTSHSSTVIETTSSGTQGTVSVVPRDDTTLMRFFSSVAIGMRDICGVESFDRQIFNLGPTTDEAPNLWLAYVMAGVAVIYTMHSLCQRAEGVPRADGRKGRCLAYAGRQRPIRPRQGPRF